MSHTPPTTTRPTFGEILGEVMDLGAGLVVGLMPLFLLTVPAVVLFVMLPAILLLVLAVPLAVAGAVLVGPPYLVVRARRRRRA